MNWEEAIKFYDIPKRYHQAKLETATLLPKEAIDLGIRWLRAPVKPSLFLQGNAGSGKTYFLISLLRHLVDSKGPYVCYQKSEKMDRELLDVSMGRLFNPYGYQVHESQLIDRFTQADILFVDDIGTEGDNDRTRKQYYTIIDERVSNQMPTVYTSNLTLEQIGKTLGDRIASRIGCSYIFEFPAVDLRRKIELPMI